MIKKSIKNIIILVLCLLITSNAHSNYIKNEKIIINVNGNKTLKTKVNYYYKLFKLFA